MCVSFRVVRRFEKGGGTLSTWSEGVVRDISDNGIEILDGVWEGLCPPVHLYRGFGQRPLPPSLSRRDNYVNCA